MCRGIEKKRSILYSHDLQRPDVCLVDCIVDVGTGNAAITRKIWWTLGTAFTLHISIASEELFVDIFIQNPSTSKFHFIDPYFTSSCKIVEYSNVIAHGPGYYISKNKMLKVLNRTIVEHVRIKNMRKVSKKVIT